MSEKMTLAAALERYKEITDGQGCTDGGCLVQRPTGMHTNGGCRCSRDNHKAQRVMYAAQIMAGAIDAHLAHPVQAVDVGAIRGVIHAMDCTGSAGSDEYSADHLLDCINDYSASLTRAIGNTQAEGWMPIATAPKDGTRVLLSSAHGVWMAEYRPVYQSGYRPDDPWCSTMLNHDHLPEAGRYAKPTHWMPLPAPPTQATPNAHE